MKKLLILILTGINLFAQTRVSIVPGSFPNNWTGTVGDTNANLVGDATLNSVIVTNGYKFSIGTKLTSATDGVLLLQDSAGLTFNRIQFGGTSATYAGIRRTSNFLEIVTADASNYLPLWASQFACSPNGVLTADLGKSGTGLNLGNNVAILWSGTGAANGGSQDIGLIKDAAGTLRVSNASTGVGALVTGIGVVAKTGAFTVLTTNSFNVFNNVGTTVRVDFTLPAGAANLVYYFYCADTDGLRILGNGAETMRIGAASSTATTGNLDTTTIGTCVCLKWVSTQWVALSSIGTWTVN